MKARAAWRPGRPWPPRGRGAALICALALLLATALIGVSICRAVFAACASANAERERGIAHQAAEAALRDAERDIVAAEGAVEPARAAQFSPAGASSFIDGCGRAGWSRGLCLARSPPAWQLQDLAAAANPAVVPYGYFTGASLAIGKGLLPARAPAYLIERLAPPGADAPPASFFRITAIGFGSRDAIRVVLQAVVRKPVPDEQAAPAAPMQAAGQARGQAPGQAPVRSPTAVQMPAGRIGWREIANWAQLHAQAIAEED